MKPFPFFLLTLGIPVASLAQENTSPQMETVSEGTGIHGPIADGQPTEPAPIPEPIEFTVKSTVTQQIFVEESPELTGLPPVRGIINATVQLVEDPGLIDPPPPLPALPPDDPAVLARLEELRQQYQGTELVFVSAEVIDHEKTLLRWYPGVI